MEFVQPIRNIEKIEEMRAYLEGKSLRDALLFTLGINTALRISEILKLKVSDVLNQDGTVKDYYELKETTVRANSKFPISKNVKRAVKEYLRDYKGNLEHPLFPSRKGNKAITRQQAWHILNDASRHVGIKERIGSHSLRKTFAYHAYLNGTDITLLQQMMNHSSPAATYRYIGVKPEKMDDSFINVNL